MASATSAQSEQGDPADAEAGNISEEQPSVPVEVDAEKLRRFAGSIVMGKADREIVLESLGCFNDVASLATAIGLPEEMVGEQFAAYDRMADAEIGKTHVCNPVTNAHLVCRLMLKKNKHYTDN